MIWRACNDPKLHFSMSYTNEGILFHKGSFLANKGQTKDKSENKQKKKTPGSLNIKGSRVSRSGADDGTRTRTAMSH